MFRTFGTFPIWMYLCDNYDANFKIDSEYITDTEITITLNACFNKAMMYWFGFFKDKREIVITCFNTITVL